MLNKNIPLSDNTFSDLRNYIYEKSGIYISDTKKYLLENRLARVLHENKLDTFEDYYSFIRTRSNGKELSRLFDAVTTNETYFFRENQQLDVFVNILAPKILKEKTGRKVIRIWSAACSSGEEPYTISMMLKEKGIGPDKFEIHASDLSENVLNSANNAVYNSYSVRNVPEPYMKKYFSANGQSYTLDESIKKTVKFVKVNLFDDKSTRAFKGMDAVFCRNVLIYFDNKAKQKTVSNIYNNLNPGGYLFIGASESLHFVTRAFRPGIQDKVVMYQKL